jgi:hypothetical protein
LPATLPLDDEQFSSPTAHVARPIGFYQFVVDRLPLCYSLISYLLIS